MSTTEEIKATHYRLNLFYPGKHTYYAVVDGEVMFKGPVQNRWCESAHTVDTFNKALVLGDIKPIPDSKE